MNYTRNLKFTTSSGRKIEIGFKKDYIFDTIEGLTGGEVEIHNTQYANYSGARYTGHKIMSRAITVEGHIMAVRSEFEEQSLRADLISTLNTEQGLGTLEITMFNGHTYYIDAIVESLTINDKQVASKVKSFQVVFNCPSPYFRSEDTEISFTEKDSAFSFPFDFKLEDENDQVFGVYGANNLKEIYNSGDVETPFVIEILGQAEAPIKLENLTTGEFILINTNINFNDKIVISTKHAQKFCKKITTTADGTTEENCFENLDFDSTFFSLQKGRNVLKFTSGDAMLTRNTINLQFNNLYNGI